MERGRDHHHRDQLLVARAINWPSPKAILQGVLSAA
jgi:hypothetical protein